MEISIEDEPLFFEIWLQSPDQVPSYGSLIKIQKKKNHIDNAPEYSASSPTRVLHLV